MLSHEPGNITSVSCFRYFCMRQTNRQTDSDNDKDIVTLLQAVEREERLKEDTMGGSED